ncbi:MAG: glycosyltransferase [Rubrivivax sp.]|nr:glycosyltransferase [Rubrivivax sp.]
MTRRVLMVAFHFPPLAGSSGIQRTLRFMQHLPACGWQPLVLTATAGAYERTSQDLMADIDPGTVVRRALALDTARHLALKGRYVGAMARPDRWVSWRFDAVRQGMRMIREFRPQAIWSTYPIATAHVIGAELQRRSGLPWVADFRDPMAQQGYPADPLTWQAYKQIERTAVERASASTFTSPSAALEYRQRYPAAAGRLSVLENGFDEEAFAGAGALPLSRSEPLNPGAVTLLHSGIVYPSERDPTQLLAALRRLHEGGVIDPTTLRLRFRAPVAEDLLRRLAAEHGVLPYLEICPAVGYREALAEMLRADALMIMQASNCNAQIPAKLYEYLRAGRPVLCLSDPAGDTAAALRAAGLDAIARLDDAQDIARLLQRFLKADGPPLRTLAEADQVRRASRQGRTEVLAGLLEGVTARP